MKKQEWTEVAVKSAGAALLIGLGDYVLLKVGNPIGPFLFAFGLLGVCVLGLKLFTGRCGFLFEDKVKLSELGLILLVNLVAGYLFGMLFASADAGIINAAIAKVESWDFSWSFFAKSVLCGAIMYLAVKLHKKGTKMGIFFGVPLFIFSGMQHSIANVITLGVSMRLSFVLVAIILLCALGNFAGALMAWLLSGQMFAKEKKHKK